MFYAKIADLTIRFDNKYDFLEKMCKDYICEEAVPDLILSATDEEISAEIEEGSVNHPAYLETLAVYRKLSDFLTKSDGLLMHGVVLNVNGSGVSFLAKSGTGKSTHMFLWKKLLGEKCTVVNGDKPLLRFSQDGIVYAYGTPWAGKEGIQTNAKIPLNNICFIERAEKNETFKIDKKEALSYLYSQIYMPNDGSSRIEIFDKLDKLIDFADFYIIRCNMDISAAETAFKVIFDI